MDEHGWKDSEQEQGIFSGEYGNILKLKMVEKTYTIRILGKYKFFRFHWFQNIQRSAICDSVNCPICAQGSKGQLKYVVNIIDRADGKVKLWEFGRRVKTAIESIADLYGTPDKYDLIVTRKGMKQDDTVYTIIPAREEKALTEEEQKLVKFDLDKLYIATPKEKVDAYLKGIVPPRTEKKVEPAIEPDHSSDSDLPTLG